MNPAQFDVIAELIRSREPARTGARLVLVDGMRKTDAAAAVRSTLGVEAPKFSTQSVNNAVGRFLRAHRLIQRAYLPAAGDKSA